MSALRSIAFNIIFYLGSVMFIPTVLIGTYRGRAAMVGTARNWAVWHRFCQRTLLGISSRIEGVLPQTACIVAIKHQSFFETIELLSIFDCPAVVMKKELTELPIWGHAALVHGMIAVDREAGSAGLREILRVGKIAINENRPIIIFPEGTRTIVGEAPEIKSGLAGLYKLLKLPIVPIALDSGRLLPRQSWVSTPGIVTWRVGETIPPGLPRDEMEARVHAAINVLNPLKVQV